MARIQPVDLNNASPEQQELLDAVKKKMGKVPNILATLARSPAGIKSYLGLSDALSNTALSAKEREQIALAIAGANSCEYCASAHTAIGAGLGIDADEAQQNLRGEASDDRTRALVTLSRTIVEKRGFLTDADLDDARNAGVSDDEIIEVVAVVTLNTLTNYVNHIAETEIDFPRVALPTPASA